MGISKLYDINNPRLQYIICLYQKKIVHRSGTHQGEFQRMTPTYKRVNSRSADLYRIENGKIVEHKDVVDQLNLLQQTGTTL